MSKKIAMFVWNYFTNDARVMRECLALQEAGYHVDLIAIHDSKQPDLPYQESPAKNFTVHRVKTGYPDFLQPLINGMKYIKRSKISLVLISCVFLLLLLFFPLQTLIVSVILALFSLKKMQVLVGRSLIFTRMVYKGLSKRYDIYHANDLNTLPQVTFCAKVFRRKKLVYDSHEVQTSRTGYNSPIYGISEKFLLRATDVCIHENDTRAAYIEKRYHFYPKVVHNYPNKVYPEKSPGVDLHGLLDIPESEPILLYQGGVQIGRGLDKLIAAVKLFDRGVVVIIGDGRIKAELQEQVRDLKMEQKVKFLPKVPLQELLGYTKNAYLGFQILNNVCFNHYSASSNKLFEYVMSGVPVIGSNFPEIRKIVRGEGIGIIVDSHDPTSIAAGVNTLLADPALRDKMSANCFQAREVYNWDLEKAIFLEIYKELEDGYDEE
ncbi:glycosyltransferase family 4 protein [Listeria weihenstephanensis]|uniref:Glycosyltransferase family 4 protein n=1 Tax=Listeria weihenstephanensis TaxID=1006155 RepID=A0A841Z7M1_9LIST|nr:glycosyltransferase [Listeria weihenstephanensis]MBC1501188.1 glycosyltransferase family 4 protein [Listeria weihenstephanensis]